MEKGKERIAKRMASAGLCSRREAEAWILAGRVVVNGQKLLTPACLVGDTDKIEVDNEFVEEVNNKIKIIREKCK